MSEHDNRFQGARSARRIAAWFRCVSPADSVRRAGLIALLGQRVAAFAAVLLVSVQLSGCTGVAPGVTPVQDFDVNRYLGKWYEIARLDHSFERGLDRVTAEYTLRDDGGLRVINSGYSRESGERKVAEGKAYFVSGESTGHLKVSFFGPFYGSYVVFELDKDGYEYAFVTSYNKEYLWLLSRTPTIAPELREKFLAASRRHGFEVEELIFVDQD